MKDWLIHEKDIIPVVQAFFDTEEVDYIKKSKSIEAKVFYKENIIDIKIIKEYCQGEKFIAKNKELQYKLDCILNLGFTFYSWLENKYSKDSQLTLSL